MTPGAGRHCLHGRLVGGFGERRGEALYTFKQPLLCFERPLAKTSSPRNALIGHAVAIGARAFSLAIFAWLVHRAAWENMRTG